MALDIAGAAAFLLITVAAFGSAGVRPGRFVAVYAVAIMAVAIVTRNARPEGSDWGLLVTGLALYSFGLLILRTMLRRSVSLRLLAAYAGERSPAAVSEDIAGRIEELGRYRLAERSGPEYRLTAAGRCLAAVLWLIYTATGLES